MSLDTYSNLQAAVQTWLDRADISAMVPDCITLAEQYFNRNLRVRHMETVAPIFSTVDGDASLPTDFLGVKSLRCVGKAPLTPKDSDEFDRLYGSRSAGTAQSYLIAGSTLSIGAVDDAAELLLRYYQKIPALSAGNPTNWLLTLYPDLYFFGTLTEAELTAKDGSSAMGWKGRRDDVCQEIQMSEGFRYRGPSPQISLQGLMP